MSQSDAEVYARYADELVHFATGLVGPDDAPDVVVEAVMRAFASTRWPQVQEPRPYLYRCVLNTARSHRRADRARRAREQRAVESDTEDAAAPDLDVRGALARLSLRQRAVVVLTYWEDLPVEQVAATLGVSAGAVHRHLARARARLREVLG